MYLWRGAVHTSKAVGLYIVVVVSPPEEIECGHPGRVVVLANHRYDSASAHLCSSSCVPHIRSALAFRHVYSPMSVVDIVQLAYVSTVELYIPSVVYSFHWRTMSMLEFAHIVCSMQVQLARDVNVRICTYHLYYTQFNWRVSSMLEFVQFNWRVSPMLELACLLIYSSSIRICLLLYSRRFAVLILGT